jgi:hypothetical protein
MSYVDARGGLTERSGDSTLVVLPPEVAGEFDLPDEFMVTGEPDVAREDGAVLLATGHPVLIQAADAALSHGDVGVVALAPPTTPAPDGAQLEQRVRDQVQVEHGKIDVTGLPTRVDRPVLRLGALVTYSLSADEHYQERLECWIDAGSGRQLGPDVVARLRAAPRAERVTRAGPPVLQAVSAEVSLAALVTRVCRNASIWGHQVWTGSGRWRRGGAVRGCRCRCTTGREDPDEPRLPRLGLG